MLDVRDDERWDDNWVISDEMRVGMKVSGVKWKGNEDWK